MPIWLIGALASIGAAAALFFYGRKTVIAKSAVVGPQAAPFLPPGPVSDFAVPETAASAPTVDFTESANPLPVIQSGNPYTRYLMAFTRGLARAEGFYVKNSRPARNNNPLDLRDSRGNLFKGLPRDAQGYVIFSTADEGWKAGRGDINVKLSGKSATGFKLNWTYYQFAALWASDSPADQQIAEARLIISEINKEFGTSFTADMQIDVTLSLVGGK
jgi:hypothetical protein